MINQLYQKQSCKDRLKAYLDAHHVHYYVHRHGTVFTAMDIAHSIRIPSTMVAKVVVATVDDTLVLLRNLPLKKNGKPYNRVTADAWGTNPVANEQLSTHHAAVASAIAASQRRSRLNVNGMPLIGETVGNDYWSK